MNIVQILLLISVVILAFPLGFLLAKATKEELKQGRRAFTSIILAATSIIFISLFLKISNDEKIFIVVGMFFIFIISYISFRESFQKKVIKIIKGMKKKSKKIKKKR